MPKSIETDLQHSGTEAPALAGEYMRNIAEAVSKISEFDSFLEALSRIVSNDSYLLGKAELCDPLLKSGSAIPDFDKIDGDETVVSVAGEAGNVGYLKFSGRQDSRPFGAEDMHLMGSIAGLISTLVYQADKFRKRSQAEKVLQYLVNKLPLGVVCFESDGSLIVESQSAARYFGEVGVDQLSKLARDPDSFVEGQIKLHMEVGNKLLFAVGRQLQVDEDLSVSAFVVYDLSKSRDRLVVDLEREAYRVESRGGQLCVALLEMRMEPGRIYRQLHSACEEMQIDASRIQPLDAHTCVCLFPNNSPRGVRSLLRSVLHGKDQELNISLISHQSATDDDSIADHLINRAKQGLESAQAALLPQLLIVDAYPSVGESLDIILGDLCQIKAKVDFNQALESIPHGIYDGIVFDLDSMSASDLEKLNLALGAEGQGVKAFYTTHKQPGMAREFHGLEGEIIFQKPFVADKIREFISQEFVLA